MARRANTKSSKTAQKDPAAKPRRRGRPPKRETETPNVPGARIIKKYGNRRLYDHTLSRAVTMEELAGAVRKGEDIRVLDGDNGEDITKRILVQIVLEDQNRQQLELLPIEFLRQIIQMREGPLSHWMSQYLAAGAEWLGGQVRAVAGGAAAPAMRTIQDSLEGLFPWMRKDGAAPMPGPSSGPMPDPDRDLIDEIGDLQDRLADLAKRVSRR